MLERRFTPVDHIAVVRGSRDLRKPNYHKAALEGNFYLRGFLHLLIFHKPRRRSPSPEKGRSRDARKRRGSDSPRRGGD
jgi:hypothetical protein